MIPASAFSAERGAHSVDQRLDSDRLREDPRTSRDAVFRETIKGVAGHEDDLAIRPLLAHQRGDVGAGSLRHDHVDQQHVDAPSGLDTLKKLAKALGVPVTELLG
jgi:hypothetical protein